MRFLQGGGEPGMSKLAGRIGAEGRLTGAEAAVLSDQIANLTRAGLPLAGGLIALGEELPPGRLRRSMNELAKTLAAGVPLEQAVASQQDKIPPNLRGLVIAGVRSGKLSDVLNRFTRYASIGLELKRSLWLSLAYPMVTSAAAASLFFFVCVFLVRQFESIYRDFNIPLPRLTIVLMFISQVASRLLIPFVILASVGVCAWLVAEVVLTPGARRSLAARLPLFGSLWRATSLAEFCHLLALLLESQLPLPEALRLTGAGVQDNDINRACELMARNVEAGGNLSQGNLHTLAVSCGTGAALAVGRKLQELARGVALGWRNVRGACAIAFRPARRFFQCDVRVTRGAHALRRAGALRAPGHTHQPPCGLEPRSAGERLAQRSQGTRFGRSQELDWSPRGSGPA